MIQPAFEILNQRGTPMFFSDVFANRPTAGIIGRIFISTDTKEFYRDTGSTWELLAGPGSGTVTGSGVAGQVTFWNGTSSVSGSNNLWWDNVTNKFLVGTNNTAGVGTLQVTSATGDNHLRIWGASSPSIRIDNAVTAATDRFVIGIASAVNNFIQGSVSGNICISTASANPLLFGMWQTINASEVMRITTANNLLLGTSVDGGQRFQVTGDSLLRGTGSTSATFGFSVQNSNINNIFRVRNDGKILFGSFDFTALYPTNDGFTTISNGLSLRFEHNFSTTNQSGFYFRGVNSLIATSGSQRTVEIIDAFQPTSGTATYAGLRVAPTINQTGGANGATFGIQIQPTLTAATDYRSIQWENTTGWGLYGIGTSPNYINGNLLIGSTNNFSKLYIGGNTGAANTIFTYSQPQINGTFTNLTSFQSTVVPSSTLSVTVTNVYHFYASQSSIGTTTINNQFGFFVDSTLSGAVTNYGFYSNIAAGGNRWNFFANGTAQNYFAGRTGFGSQNLTGYGIRLTIGHTGSTSTFGIMSEGVVANDVTGLAVYYGSSASSVSGFSLGEIVHYRCDQGSFGTSTITQQSGFQVRNTLTGATNNYGFRGLISSGTGRWNLYMDGAGANHMAGNLLLGSTTNPGQLLYVSGSIRVDGQRSATAGGASGQHLIINCDGVDYKIALLNP